MSKYFLWIPFVMAIGTTLYNPKKEVRTVKAENKNILLAVYKGSDYTSEAYNNTLAEVHIVVEKANTKGEHAVVWDSTFHLKNLRQYPSLEKAQLETIVVPNVNNKKEHLEVTYFLTYDSNGSELQMQGTDVITENNKKVEISI